MNQSKKVDQIIKHIEHNLMINYGTTLETSSMSQIYASCCQSIRDEIMPKWLKCKNLQKQQQSKKLYYLSVEFLQGRALSNNLLALGENDLYVKALKKLGIDLNEIEKLEPDPGLGNGGLGRLASCFLDSLATLDYPAMGCGIRYEYGLFRQKIIDDSQVEIPDNWLERGGGSYPWEIVSKQDTVEIRFGGEVIETWEENSHTVKHVNYDVVNAVPYDVPILGYQTDNIATLRLWSAVSPKSIDMDSFSRGDYVSSMKEKELAEVISKVLYPCENHIEGKSLRLKQHYFFTSATIQNIIKDFKNEYGNDLKRLSEKVTIQINDTHPSLAIPELMRILLDEEGYNWSDAWEIVTGVFNYTNHTVMQEALEKWPEQLFKDLLPRLYGIVKAINEQLCARLWEYYPGQWDKIGKMAIIGYNEIRMANLCIYASSKVNGVSKLHGEILKSEVFRDFFVIEPWKFLGITNGITPRRWLMLSNPELSSLIDKTIGDSWHTDLMKLEDLLPYAKDSAFVDEFAQIKRNNKVKFSNWYNDKFDKLINPDSIFDVQAKRLHEYKRQILNALHIIYLYDRLLNEPDFDMNPTTFIFGAKASANYSIAKLTIRLINIISKKISYAPQRIKDKINVIFLENYNVSSAQLLIPAANISEQISTAGKEASGTGNMKFMMNGAVTLGTMDGANVEISDLVGPDNIFIFGLNAQQTSELYQSNSYSAGIMYEENNVIRKTLDYLINGELDDNHERQFNDLYHLLLFGQNGSNADPYLVLKDFMSYVNAHNDIDIAYSNKSSWNEKAIINTAKSGYFSSDRTIEEYNQSIWHLNKLKI